ncbi:FixH family protein [Actinosynnema sp. CS-041913]|uniref:FixH family protein n=1 Tax=Actinosynnema sp. CS-041913 TaxID=3239917 RepID=UPI003D94F345
MTGGRAGRRAGADRSQFWQGAVLGLCIGVTLALVLGIVAFVATRPTASLAAADTPPQQAGGPVQASIDITAEHLGDLKVAVEARVSAPGSYDPITKGQVVAYTDMVAMPMMHRQGPIVMAEVAGRPGVYQAQATVDMVGEYNVTVEVKQPMAAKADRRIDVQSVSPK